MSSQPLPEGRSLSNVTNLINDLAAMNADGSIVGMMSVAIVRKNNQTYVSMCNIAIEGAPPQVLVDGLEGLAEMVQEAIASNQHGTPLQ